MIIVFRVDASFDIGMGHVMRCLTLAEYLKQEGISVKFICRKVKGDCIQLIEKKGFEVFALTPIEDSIWTYTKENWKQDAKESIEILQDFDVDYVIVDHYAIDEKWENLIRLYTNKIMVIDDVADRPHECDVLLDQNYYENATERYISFVSEKCKLLLGPTYTLLRPEFLAARKKMGLRNGIVNSIMISFGGSDPTNETMKVLLAIKDQEEIQAHVIVGQSNVFKEDIEKICSQYSHLHYYCQINNMAELMIKADLAIGAGGSTSWERCCLGLPSVIVTTAENQVELANNIAKVSVTQYLGHAQNIEVADWKYEIDRVVSNKCKLVEMYRNGLKLVDGLGVERVVKAIIS